MQMARSIDSNNIDLSLEDFDIGIDFDVLEENFKKIIERPIEYLDSAHGKAVELFEDVYAMLWPTFPDGEVPNTLHETSKDPSNSNVTASLPTSVETKLVGTNSEVSNRASLITVENGFPSCIDMDAHETESVLTENPENISSKLDHVEANDLCLLPKDTLITEAYDSTTSEEIILWNPENSGKPPRLPEPTTVSEDDYVPHTLDTGKVAEQVGPSCSSAHSDIPLENSGTNYEEHAVLHSAKDPVEAAAHETTSPDLSADVSRCVEDSTKCPDDDMTKFVTICLRNGQENTKDDELEAPFVYPPQNTSFKKMFMRNLSSKLGWSKKQTSVQQALPAIPQQYRENLGFQSVSSSYDDLDDDWEVV